MFHKFTAAIVFMGALLGAQHASANDYSNPKLLISVADLAPGKPGPERVVLDVRGKQAYRDGHIPGAIRLDPNAVVAAGSPIDGALKPVAQIARMFGKLGIGPDTEVVLYDDKGGFHAARMFWVLEYLGHKKVALLNGGITAWIAAGRDLRTGSAPAAKPQDFSPALTPRRFASADWILDRRDDPDVAVIDVRPSALWAKGHIPWGRNIPWKGNLREDKMMKSESDLLRHFAERGITPDMNIVVHCQNGLASAHSYFALRLIGFSRVRTYHRSWAEWGMADDLPKATATAG